MNTSKYLTPLAFLLMFILGCQNRPSENEQATNATKKDCSKTPKFAVSIETAKKNIDNLPLDFPVKSFTIRSIDLVEALGMPLNTETRYEYVRVYLGMNDSSQFKLFLTPVKGANLNVNPPKPGKDYYLCGKVKNSGTTELVEGDYLLDFAMPCPNTCPETPLYK